MELYGINDAQDPHHSMVGSSTVHLYKITTDIDTSLESPVEIGLYNESFDLAFRNEPSSVYEFGAHFSDYIY